MVKVHPAQDIVFNTILLIYVAGDEYMFVSIERGCRKGNIASKCTTTQMQSKGGYKIVCQESCENDKCNVGWRKFSFFLFQHGKVNCIENIGT